jgi:hypothetical protein
MNTMGKRYHPATIVLLVLTGWRLWGQFEYIMASMGALIMFVAYLIALIGILLRSRWGAVIIGLLAILDVPLTLYLVSGANRIGALVIDLLIICLAYENYKLVASKKPAMETLQDDSASPPPET